MYSEEIVSWDEGGIAGTVSEDRRSTVKTLNEDEGDCRGGTLKMKRVYRWNCEDEQRVSVEL